MSWVTSLALRAASTSIINPWVVLGALVVLLVMTGSAAYLGYDYAQAKCAAEDKERLLLLEQIRSANREFAESVATRTETAIGKIRQVHRTVIQPEIRHEREIHRVLTDPSCSVPESTVRVLNRARGHIDGRAGADQPAPAVPAPRAPADQPRAAPR